MLNLRFLFLVSWRCYIRIRREMELCLPSCVKARLYIWLFFVVIKHMFEVIEFLCPYLWIMRAHNNWKILIKLYLVFLNLLYIISTMFIVTELQLKILLNLLLREFLFPYCNVVLLLPPVDLRKVFDLLLYPWCLTHWLHLCYPMLLLVLRWRLAFFCHAVRMIVCHCCHFSENLSIRHGSSLLVSGSLLLLAMLSRYWLRELFILVLFLAFVLLTTIIQKLWRRHTINSLNFCRLVKAILLVSLIECWCLSLLELPMLRYGTSVKEIVLLLRIRWLLIMMASTILDVNDHLIEVINLWLIEQTVHIKFVATRCRICILLIPK